MKKYSIKQQDLNRRQFLKITGALAAMAYIPSSLQASGSDRLGPVLPTRKLGKTGMDVTMFCVGGGPYDFKLLNEKAILETALEGGCRFFETARQYGRGESEIIFGRTLESYRKEIILSSKSGAHDAETLNSDLEKSLESLRTSYLDIYMMHSTPSIEDFKRKIDGGVYEAMVKAKQEGKIRHIGFSGHSGFEINNYVMDLNLPDLEVMLLPVNVIDTVHNSFVINTLPKALEKNIGVIAMKPLGGGGMLGVDITWGQGRGRKRPRVIPEILSMREAQHFAYSMPVSSVTFGCTSTAQIIENISLAKSYVAMGKEEQTKLIEKVTEVAQGGLLEHYKNVT